MAEWWDKENCDHVWERVLPPYSKSDSESWKEYRCIHCLKKEYR